MHSLVERTRNNRACCLPCETNTDNSLFQLSVKFWKRSGSHSALNILLGSQCYSSFSCVVITCPCLAPSLSQELIDTLSQMTHPPVHQTLYLLNSAKVIGPTTFFVVNNSRTNGCVPYFTIQYSLWRNPTLIQPSLLTLKTFALIVFLFFIYISKILEKFISS